MGGAEEVEVAEGLKAPVMLALGVLVDPGAFEAPPWQAVESTVTRQRSAGRALMTKRYPGASSDGAPNEYFAM